MIRNTGSSGSSLIGSSQNTSNLPGLYGGTSLLNTSFPTERLLDGVKSQFFKYELRLTFGYLTFIINVLIF